MKRRCPARESGGFRCEMPAEPEHEHWISDATILASDDRSGPWAPDPPEPGDNDPWSYPGAY